jgi:hypothetical protein
MAVEIRLRGKYRVPGSSKKNKGKSSGNSGSSGKFHKPPAGIRKQPRRRYG